MHIEIAQRLRPFSHQPGARFYLPWAQCTIRVYPAYLEVENVGKLPLPFKGPVKKLTTLLDLERSKLEVFGEGANGFSRIPLELPIKRAEFTPKEKLSFGCHKEQNWDKMLLRQDPAELLPHWHRLGQWEGDITQAYSGELFPDVFEQFAGCFEDYFIHNPDLWNKMAWDQPSPLSSSPLLLGAALLRALIIREEEGNLIILDKLPNGQTSGRYLNAQFPWGTVDLEWSKGLLRRMIIHAERNHTISLKLQKDIKTFRLRNSLIMNDLRINIPAVITLEANQTYYLDRFEK